MSRLRPNSGCWMARFAQKGRSETDKCRSKPVAAPCKLRFVLKLALSGTSGRSRCRPPLCQERGGWLTRSPGITPMTARRRRKTEASGKESSEHGARTNAPGGATTTNPTAAPPTPPRERELGQAIGSKVTAVCDWFPWIESLHCTTKALIQGSSYLFRGHPTRRRLQAPCRPPL